MKKQLVLVAMVSALFMNSYGCSEEGINHDGHVPLAVASPVMAPVLQEQRDRGDRESNQPNARMSDSSVMVQVPPEQRGRRGWKSRLRALGITVVGVGTGVFLLYAGHLLLHVIEMHKFRNILGNTPWFMQ